MTGNFITLSAALVFGTKGAIAKLIALPEFICVVAIARRFAAVLTTRTLPTLRILLAVEVQFLLAFFVLVGTLGPFSNSDTVAAFPTAFAGIPVMVMRNAACTWAACCRRPSRPR